MHDSEIVDLFWERSENAVAAASAKYGKYCFSIAWHILGNAEDAEESVNDTYLAAWNAIPPHRPSVLSTFLGKITRRISIDRWRNRTAGKRSGGQMDLALDELSDCIPTFNNAEQAVESLVLAQTLNRFLSSLEAEARKIFVQRYWYLLSVKEIAEGLDVSESKVKMSLMRSRMRLRQLLEEEEVSL